MGVFCKFSVVFVINVWVVILVLVIYKYSVL